MKIIMTNSLCHSTKPGVVISEAYRCLKGSGLLLIKDLFSEGSNINSRQLEVLRKFSDNLHMAFHEPSAIVKLLDQRGFKECEFVRLHTEKESESSMSFVRACFDGRRLTEFGEVVLKGLPGVVETLGTAPFEEGVWIAIKP